MASIIEKRRAKLAGEPRSNGSETSLSAGPAAAGRQNSPQAAASRRNSPTDTDPEAHPLPSAALSPDFPSATPCPVCRSPVFWLDAYGGLHCCECSPARTPKMMRARLEALAVVGGGFEWGNFNRPAVRQSSPASPGSRQDNGSGDSGGNGEIPHPAGPAQASGPASGQTSGLHPRCLDMPPVEFTDFVCRSTERFQVLSRGGIRPGIPLSAGLAANAAKSPAAVIPVPPKSAAIYYLRPNGNIQAAVRTGKGAKAKSGECADAVMMTWEGADRWWELPKQPKAEKSETPEKSEAGKPSDDSAVAN